MDSKSYRDSKYAMFTLAHSLGTKEVSQASLVNALHNIENENLNQRETLLQMINVFHDGLAYGNWPKQK